MTKSTSLLNSYKSQITNSLQEKYHYFIIGLLVILFIFSLIVRFVQKQRVFISQKPNNIAKIVTKSSPLSVPIPTPTITQKVYVVKAGDYLWGIAQDAYGSGFNAYDIAKANKLDNPSLIYAGQTLVMPNATSGVPTRGEIIEAASTAKVTKSITSYTVKTGDYLWKIALEAYGDGYAWTRLAKANNITNPDIIFTGQTLNIP